MRSKKASRHYEIRNETKQTYMGNSGYKRQKAMRIHKWRTGGETLLPKSLHHCLTRSLRNLINEMEEMFGHFLKKNFKVSKKLLVNVKMGNLNESGGWFLQAATT